MQIIGVDLHTRQQSVSMVDTETGEVTEKTLLHEGEAVREFYAAVPRAEMVSPASGALSAGTKLATEGSPPPLRRPVTVLRVGVEESGTVSGSQDY
jgi:hypothetical protein